MLQVSVGVEVIDMARKCLPKYVKANDCALALKVASPDIETKKVIGSQCQCCIQIG